MHVVVEQVPVDQRRSCRALTHIVNTVNKEAVTARVIDNVIVRDVEPVKGLGVAEDSLATAGNAPAVHHVLVDGDIRSTPV